MNRMEEFMNLPNKLTIFRILCIPVFVVLMLVNTIPYNNYIAVGVFIQIPSASISS